MFKRTRKNFVCCVALTVKALNVQKVRLGLSRLARLAYEAFYEPVDRALVGEWLGRFWFPLSPVGTRLKR